MKGFSVLILSLMCSTSYCQHFCHTFAQNQRVIPLYNKTTKESVFIIDNNYWNISEIRDQNTGDWELLFSANTPIGSDHSLTSNSFPIKWGTADKLVYGLINPKTKEVVAKSYSNGVFQEVSRHKVDDPLNLSANITAVLTEPDLHPHLVSQYLDHNSQLVSTFFEVTLDLNTNGSVVIHFINDESSVFNQDLMKHYITVGYVLVGSLSNIWIFQLNRSISYCDYRDCYNGEPLKHLIDCNPYATTTTTSTTTTTRPTTSIHYITENTTKTPELTTNRPSPMTQTETRTEKTTTPDSPFNDPIVIAVLVMCAVLILIVVVIVCTMSWYRRQEIINNNEPVVNQIAPVAQVNNIEPQNNVVEDPTLNQNNQQGGHFEQNDNNNEQD